MVKWLWGSVAVRGVADLTHGCPRRTGDDMGRAEVVGQQEVHFARHSSVLAQGDPLPAQQDVALPDLPLGNLDSQRPPLDLPIYLPREGIQRHERGQPDPAQQAAQPVPGLGEYPGQVPRGRMALSEVGQGEVVEDVLVGGCGSG